MSQEPSVRTSPEAPRSSLPGARSALYVVHPPELVGQMFELFPQSVVRIGSVLGVVDERPVPGAEWTAALPGITPAVVRARDALRHAGSGLAPVLILGETGTGKERVAAEIHAQSARSGPYVK